MFFFIFGYNDLTELTSEKIAMESLAILTEEQVLANLVANDFENEFAEWGAVVKATYPSEMTADRTPVGGTAAVNSVTGNSHYVKLDQWITQAFALTSHDKQKSFQNLVEFFIAPAARSMNVMRDRIIQGAMFESYPYSVGKIGTALDYADVTEADTLMSEQFVPRMGRSLVVGPRLAKDIRDMSDFISNVSSTDPSLVRTGEIGFISGFKAIETASFTTVSDSTKVTGAVNNASGEPEGDTAITVDNFSAAITSGSWCTIAGVPYRITGTTGGATPTALAIEGGLREDVANDAVVHVFTPAVVNEASGYAAGYDGAITYDGGITPKLGQGVTFSTDGVPYSIVKVDSTTIWLNRPLDVAIANDDKIFLMPGGKFGIGLYRNSIQIVNRPLALPGPNQGVDAAVVSGDGWSMRVMRNFTMLSSKETVMLDFLMGLAVHNPQYNVLFLG